MDPNTKIALILRGGPENGPFSAGAVRRLCKIFKLNNLNVSAIFANSASVPTGLLASIGEQDKICDIWRNLRPVDITGSPGALNRGLHVVLGNSVLKNKYLESLLRSHCDFDKVLSLDSIRLTIPAVDELTGQLAYFCNRDKRLNKTAFVLGCLASMALTPFFPPVVIDNCDTMGLLKNPTGMFLDGGYKCNVPLEKAIRDPEDFNLIILVDVHDLGVSPADPKDRNHWSTHLHRATHIVINSNDNHELQFVDRINEEIEIRDKLDSLRTKLLLEDSPFTGYVDDILWRMNQERLQLHNKRITKVEKVSDRTHSVLFNFAKFEPEEVAALLDAGDQAALNLARKLHLNT